jgi:hypothetical protein
VLAQWRTIALLADQLVGRARDVGSLERVRRP